MVTHLQYHALSLVTACGAAVSDLGANHDILEPFVALVDCALCLNWLYSYRRPARLAPGEWRYLYFRPDQVPGSTSQHS
jgi:hypothetical protein